MYNEEKQMESEIVPKPPGKKPSRKQLLYQRRSQTTPYYMLASSNSTLPTRFPIQYLITLISKI
ncbi:hypothetical protein BLA29_014334 [Euroglyphus maynei]|uniref:Uncharacterized protein n=1 Tax=Euroglyphus maynei TaxID=6958 RepID=A0A1Y3AZ13_EURMA|nr:hypothetical protein BLA29_014334 [Euroglyphus maynei]